MTMLDTWTNWGNPSVIRPALPIADNKKKKMAAEQLYPGGTSENGLRVRCTFKIKN